MSNEFETEKNRLSQIVKSLRQDAGLSQRDLSRMTGINQADICKIEKGTANPSLNTISRIMDSLNVSLSIDYVVKDNDKEYLVETWGNVDKNIIELSQKSVSLVRKALKSDLEMAILYGSCARGENTCDSDVDIALITACDRIEAKKYDDKLADIATRMMMEYTKVVNFVSLPLLEYSEKKSWYPYFKNIDREGIVIYARG